MAARSLLVVAAAMVGNAASQFTQCSYMDIDYSSLTNNFLDYDCPSTIYPNFDFVFNICRELVYVNSDCVAGSAICERLIATKSATDVYGTFVSANWQTDTSGVYLPGNYNAPYSAMTGDACAQLGGGVKSARVYHVCDETAFAPYTTLVYESFAECQVFVALHSTAACGSGGGPSPPGPPSPSPPSPVVPGGQTGGVDGTDIGMIVCIIFFLGGGAYFAGGGYMNHKKGEVGYDRVPHKEFWGSLPGLIKDGCFFTKEKIRAKIGGGDSGGSYQDL